MENGNAELQHQFEVFKAPEEHTKVEMHATYQRLKENPEVTRFVEEAFAMVEGAGSSMATYWLSFMNMIEILLMNIHALRTQDWDAFKWLQIYDNKKYGRWLVEF